jgi:L-ribulokinase
MKAMGQGFDTEYHPNKEKVAIYAKRYIKYKEAGTFIESNLSS